MNCARLKMLIRKLYPFTALSIYTMLKSKNLAEKHVFVRLSFSKGISSGNMIWYWMNVVYVIKKALSQEKIDSYNLLVLQTWNLLKKHTSTMHVQTAESILMLQWTLLQSHVLRKGIIFVSSRNLTFATKIMPRKAFLHKDHYIISIQKPWFVFYLCKCVMLLRHLMT